jgi:hypothetical protein
MSEWLYNGLNGKGLKNVFRLYIYTLLILVPIAAVVIIGFGDKQAFRLLPFAVILVIGIQHLISRYSRRGTALKKTVTAYKPPSTGGNHKIKNQDSTQVFDFVTPILKLASAGLLPLTVVLLMVVFCRLSANMPSEAPPGKIGGLNGNKAANTSTTSTSGDKIGVPECDDFLAKYEACVRSRVPAAAQAVFNSSVEQMRKSWKEAAATPQGKAGLAAGCKQALETAKSSMSAYGCNW